jgi:hypothetical protein
VSLWSNTLLTDIATPLLSNFKLSSISRTLHSPRSAVQTDGMGFDPHLEQSKVQTSSLSILKDRIVLVGMSCENITPQLPRMVIPIYCWVSSLNCVNCLRALFKENKKEPSKMDALVTFAFVQVHHCIGDVQVVSTCVK